MTMTMNRAGLIATCALVALGLGCSGGEKAVKADMTAKAEAAKTEAAKTEARVDAAKTEAKQAATDATDPLKAAVANPARPEDERKRDAARRPYETLKFFGVQPEHAVLELWAGGGWYTHILAPYLVPKGKLHVTTYSADAKVEYQRNLAAKMSAYLTAQKYTDKVVVHPINEAALDFGLENQVDVVLTFRNIHNWVKGGYDKAVYAQAFKALKPGGVFGVVEHRGAAGMTREQSAESGYMDQAQVIKDIEAAGFKLVEASEINANPKDTKDHPKGVWTLPPRLRLGDQDRAKYEAIGESDRMTLKFIKPKA